MSWHDLIPIPEHEKFWCSMYSFEGEAPVWLFALDKFTKFVTDEQRAIDYCRSLSHEALSTLMTTLSCLDLIDAVDELVRVIDEAERAVLLKEE